MGYTTPEAVRERVVGGVGTTDGLPDTPSTAADVAPDVLDAAIVDADAKIDGYLGGRYSVPFNPVPAQVASWSTALAAWFATLALNAQQETGPNNPVRLRYIDALADLNLARAGQLELGAVTASTAAAADAGAVFNRLPGELFTPEEFGVTFEGAVPVVGRRHSLAHTFWPDGGTA